MMPRKILNASLIAILSSLTLAACQSGSSSPVSVPTPAPTPSPIPDYCESNIANFSSISGINLEEANTFDPEWGPSLANLPFPQNLSACQESLGWNQQRVIAAATYWVSQKVNYCHHHVPTWTPNPLDSSAFLACESGVNVMPDSATYNTVSRWNYSGSDSQTAAAWYTFSARLAHGIGNYVNGLDCSDYSKLNYAYAESINFTSAIAPQAGQESNESAFGPNDPRFNDAVFNTPGSLPSAGQLVCADGTVAPPPGQDNSTSCNSHGGYISVFGTNSQYIPNAITNNMLNNLQAGDLLYIAGCGSDNNALNNVNCGFSPQQLVTHVIMWTGQKAGLSTTITDAMLAPETDTDVYGNAHHECESGFWSAANNQESWIITDSHYQGPDFRPFTNCFYRNQVWGVRRVLGYSQN